MTERKKAFSKQDHESSLRVAAVLLAHCKIIVVNRRAEEQAAKPRKECGGGGWAGLAILS